MKPRNTLIVVALFALLLGYVYFVELDKTPEQLGTPAPTAQPAVLSLDPSNVNTIEIRDLRAAREIQITRNERNWQVVKPESKQADNNQVDSVLLQLTTLQASRVLTNVTDLAPFGFVTATLEARLVMSDTTPYALTVGNKTPDGSSYYVVYTGDRSKVYIVTSSWVETLIGWLNTPPYQPTPTPTFTPTPPETPTIASTEPITATPTVSPPPGTPTP
ncbi:MAG: DUF4340 domain-containing protein [Chloroflexi bacterium]|nr:DUF4340 domain-containing protein [Chloroflexota bacterium]